ncbi:MAG TPA: STAS/SEC14 domain-containing protein, partial [Wenzhouxiangella sp.]|nr:STAS/SEC14 domain-containing protein [Wenzhouxiangella sp.]
VVEGRVTEQDFEQVAGRLEAFIEAHGKIKVLEVLESFKGFDAAVLGKGVLFDLKHIKNISHCAVVSDSGWIGPLTRAVGAVVSCEIKVFGHDQIDQARTWLREAG